MISLAIFLPIINFFRAIARILEKPELRVRKIDLTTGHESYGVVKVEKNFQKPHSPEPQTYWTVEWEGNGVWITYPACSFLWYRGYHNLLEK